MVNKQDIIISAGDVSRKIHLNDHIIYFYEFSNSYGVCLGRGGDEFRVLLDLACHAHVHVSVSDGHNHASND